MDHPTRNPWQSSNNHFHYSALLVFGFTILPLILCSTTFSGQGRCILGIKWVLFHLQMLFSRCLYGKKLFPLDNIMITMTILTLIPPSSPNTQSLVVSRKGLLTIELFEALVQAYCLYIAWVSFPLEHPLITLCTMYLLKELNQWSWDIFPDTLDFTYCFFLVLLNSLICPCIFWNWWLDIQRSILRLKFSFLGKKKKKKEKNCKWCEGFLMHHIRGRLCQFIPCSLILRISNRVNWC